jgi:hypothetical protein
MRRSRFTDEQKISTLQQPVPGKIRDLCRKHGISEQEETREPPCVLCRQEVVGSIPIRSV